MTPSGIEPATFRFVAQHKAKGEWRKLHKEQLNDLYCSPHIIRL